MAAAAGQDMSDYDFAIIHHRNGFDQMKLWKVNGLLELAMQDVVISMIDGEMETDHCEFGLGFLAALDILGRGKLNLPSKITKQHLTNYIKDAYDDMHGIMSGCRKTDLMTRACETLLARNK